MLEALGGLTTRQLLGLELIVIAIWMLLFGGLGAYVASAKRREVWEGMVLGGLFGILGVVVEALLPSR